MTMTIRKSLAVLALVGVATVGCVDLEVVNPNAADQERALNTPGDIEALVAGGYGTLWSAHSANSGPGPILMTMANAHSATAANFGMVEFSGWPRVPAQNRSADVYSSQNSQNAWTWIYRSISSVVEGLRILDGGEVTLPAAELRRAQAYGYFVLGVAHGSASILYDKGYIYDPTMTVDDVELHDYMAVNQAAMNYFDRAIQEASGGSFELPAPWMSREVSSQELVQMAYSNRARYRANVARTPAERAAVNWNAVISDVDNGLPDGWDVTITSGSGFSSGTYVNIFRFGPWGQLSYQVLGMADQAGQYQDWISRNPDERHPNLSPDQTSQPFLIQTPDNRFPTGTTIAEQQANRGTKWEVTTRGGGFGAQWARPDRGTFRWSYYRTWIHDQWQSNAANRTTHPDITRAEMQLLKAEGLYRNGDLAGAAAIVNEFRTEAGLNATDAAGTNTSCVPRLPNGSCGDLFEMLKWEKRLETQYSGLHHATWYFDSRGWGDLAQGSFLQIPMPERELELLGLPVYTFGGIGGEFSAPVGNYGY
jgi:hypothetical protein